MLLDSARRVNDSGAYLKPGSGPRRTGIVYVVAGCSGWTDVRAWTTRHVRRFRLAWPARSEPAWLNVIDIDGNRLDAKFLRETGAIDDQSRSSKVRARSVPHATLRISDGTITHMEIEGRQPLSIGKNVQPRESSLDCCRSCAHSTGVTTRWLWSVGSEAASVFFRVADLMP